MIEAASINVYTHEKVFINFNFPGQPKDAAGQDIMVLTSCILRAMHLINRENIWFSDGMTSVLLLIRLTRG